ncbi:hypothetical protein QBC35DRAFT_367104, partial [Podospora australis]
RELVYRYRGVIEDKCEESSRLKVENDHLKSQLVSQDNSSAWTRNFLPSLRRENANPFEDEKVQDAFRNIKARYENLLSELKSENCTLQQLNMQQQSEIQTQRSNFARELEAITSKNGNRLRKVSDTDIQAKWKSLGFLIRQFVQAYFPESLDQPTSALVGSCGPHPCISDAMRHQLQSYMLCPVLLESWVWHILSFCVF